MFSMERLTGPILDKELRVSSRRRRFFVLRFAYLAALTIFVLLTWKGLLEDAAHTHYYSSASAQAVAIVMQSRMADVGRQIVGSLLWFQFIAAQIMAVLLLSTAVNGEITARTLGVLMTTPIGSFQIVLGKLLSKVLQVFILIAISLPVLAVVRILGGVTWGDVVCGLCVTMASTVLVGSLTIYISSRSSNALRTIFVSAGIYTLFLLVPLKASTPAGILEICTGAVPARNSSELYVRLFTGVAVWLSWSTLLLHFAAIRTRRSAMGTMNPTHALQPPDGVSFGNRHPRTRAVRGTALIWKDLRFYLPSTRRRTVLFTLGVSAAMLVSYLSFAAQSMLREPVMHVFYVFLYLGPAALLTALMAATSLTVEKESQALTLLLTTPMSDEAVIGAKAYGLLQRVLPVLILLAFHLLFFTAAGYLRWLAACLVALVAVATLSFLAGVGIYISSRVRTSSTAVSLNVLVCAVLFLAAPILAGRYAGDEDSSSRWLADSMVAMNPFVQMTALAGGGTIQQGADSADQSFWEFHLTDRMGQHSGPAVTAGEALFSSVVYLGLAMLLACRAKVNLRRHLFN